jgi:tetratricopeptide (TPR) repeat protein
VSALSAQLDDVVARQRRRRSERRQRLARHLVGEVERAILGCSNIITAGRESGNNLAIAYYERGDAYVARGNPDHAIADETKAIKLNPNSLILALAYIDRGRAYGNKGDYNGAITDDTKAIELKPRLADADLADVYLNRGVAYGNKGDHYRAIADETKAIELNPQLAGAYINRGYSHSANFEFDQEIADETKAIEPQPANALRISVSWRSLPRPGRPRKGAGRFSYRIAADPG